MNTSYPCNAAISRQFRVLALGKHAILKLYLAIIQQQLEAVTCKKFLLVSIAYMVFLGATFFNALDLGSQLLFFARHMVLYPFFFLC